MERVLEGNIVRLDAFNGLELVLILSNAADGNTQAVDEEAISHCDVC